MTKVFKAGCPNFPANQDELDKRLAEIESLINNKDDNSRINIEFIEAAFQLVQDCDLITDNLVNYLAYPQKFTPEGVLRFVKDYNDILDANNYVRFYKGTKRRLELNEKTFLLSKEWFPANKKEFYNWLARKAQAACEEHWQGGIVTPPPPPPPKEIDYLKAIYHLLKNLNNKVDELNEEVKTLREFWK